jgi:glycosyltransferase involved in cell wall biosynthesis
MNVSIITACKNRRNALEISLRSWLMFEEVKEVIITDWSSDEPITDLADLDTRVKIITVSDKQYFNQPQPLNLAASIATGDYILKFDVDHVLNPYYNFFENYLIDDTNFLSGSPDWESPEYVDENGCAVANPKNMTFEQIKEWCNVYSPYFKSLFGVIFVKRENFLKCGGFNENLGHYYGFEDEELQKRFEKLGLSHKKLNPAGTSIFHLPHPDIKRVENFKGNATDAHIPEQVRNNLSQYYSGDALKYQIEYVLPMYHVGKNKEIFSNPKHYYVPVKTKWDLNQIEDQIYEAKEKTFNPLENFPPVYYVTLEECTDRQNLLEKQFKKYGISPKAIKSKRFSESDDIITGKYLYQLTGPTQGCIVSHLKAIKKWYEGEESEYAFFCEDDLSLKTVEYWNFTWEEFINLLPDDCECVQLMTVRGDFEDIKFRDRIWDDWSETAYIMNRDYARKIIDNYCVGDSFHLELKDLDIMPIGENTLFTNVGKVYTFPLFTENVDIPTTDVNDLELENGQKPNHVYSSEYVYHWWKNNGKNKSIYDLMGKEKIKKTFSILDEDETEVPVEKTELEKLTHQYSLNTESPSSNFNIACWYEKEEHTAPALSYYLRCAERAAESDPDLAYEALIRGSYCYEKQGTRDGSSRSLMWQAQMFLPHRPEAYYLLARFSERREWWQDCYTTCDLALKHCDFEGVPLKTNIEYPGKQGILFLKGISAWWWGKGDESRNLFKDILTNYKLNEVSYNLIYDHLKKVNGEL